MKGTQCDYEEAVEKAARQGGWDESPDESLGESLRAHLDSCGHCREIATAAGWMVTLAGDTRNDPALPDPGLIWLRARIEEIQKANERAQRPLEIAHVAALVAGVVGAVGLLAWEGSPLREWQAALPEIQVALAPVDLGSAGVPAVALGLTLFALLLLLRPLLAHD